MRLLGAVEDTSFKLMRMPGLIIVEDRAYETWDIGERREWTSSMVENYPP